MPACYCCLTSSGRAPPDGSMGTSRERCYDFRGSRHSRLDERQYDQALQELRKALRPDPNSVAALFYQGLVYAAMHRHADAAAAWERALQLHPTDLDVGFQLGTLYFADEQYDRADPCCNRSIRSNPPVPISAITSALSNTGTRTTAAPSTICRRTSRATTISPN
jgi:tetratricopeptide (TPR) repeat protein